MGIRRRQRTLSELRSRRGSWEQKCSGRPEGAEKIGKSEMEKADRGSVERKWTERPEGERNRRFVDVAVMLLSGMQNRRGKNLYGVSKRIQRSA